MPTEENQLTWLRLGLGYIGPVSSPTTKRLMDYKTPEIIVQRVQKQAVKSRQASRYFTIEVVSHSDQPEAPKKLRYTISLKRVREDAELDGVYLLVAGGKGATLAEGVGHASHAKDAQILVEWKGQHKVERCFHLVNQVFLVAPLFLKTPQRIAAMVFLIMVGALVAGLIERQVRQVLARLQQPIKGLMPEGRDTLRPSIERIFKAFADYGFVYVKDERGQVIEFHFARLNAVQEQILKVLSLPRPAEVFVRPSLE